MSAKTQSEVPTPEQLVDAIGDAADTIDNIDNIIAAEDIPMPAILARHGRLGALKKLRNELRDLHIRGSGCNPWQHHPKD